MEDKIETLLTFKEVLGAVHGKYVGLAGNHDAFCFTSVVTDSRNVTRNSLFIPLIGEFQDGHKYIPQALEKGASVVFVTSSVYDANANEYMNLISEYPSSVFIVVENNMRALQDAACAYVKKFPELIKISVTGSSGKTTTKEILASIFREKYSVVTNEGNLNSETGLPLSVFNIRKRHQVGIFEMGMNRENEIGEIAAVFRPDHAVITNIGNAHVGLLGSRENIAREKRKVFSFVGSGGTAVIPAEDDFSSFLCEGVKGKVIKYGLNVPESESGVRFVSDDGVMGIRFYVDGKECVLKIPGIYNYLNALGAIVLARRLGLSADEICAGISKVKLPGGRSKILRVITPADSQGRLSKILLMHDCYNANPDSMEKVLQLCSSLSLPGRKIYILGDMFELGTASVSEHSRIGGIAAISKASLIVFIGKNMENAARTAKLTGFSNVRYFPDYSDDSIKEICKFLLGYFEDNDFVMLKASHGMGFDRIASAITGSLIGDGGL